jgi:hypothetical protein
MAVQIERIAMVLSAMRGGENPHTMRGNEHTEGRIPSGIMDETSGDNNRPYMVDTLYCSDEDYETAEMIGNKMLLHMAAAYRMIDGDAQDVVPEIKPIDQRKVVFEQLKAEYALGELIQEAKSQGVSRSSAIRWNNEWIEKGMVTKENHGIYRKVA